jgi:hypothetical protein
MNRYKIYSILRDLFSIIFVCGSFIIIPLFSYLWNDWWLLFGITFWWLGMFLATARYKILVFIPLLLSLYWYDHGFNLHQRVTFFSAGFALGYLLITVACRYKRLYDRSLRNNLINKVVTDYGNVCDVSKDMLPYIVLQINDFAKENPGILITRDFVHDFCEASVSTYLTNRAKRENLN